MRNPNHSLRLLPALGATLVCCSVTWAGEPLPYAHTEAYREANKFMLQFQEELAAGEWGMAITRCSDRVRRQAETWPSTEAFFRETTPLDKILTAFPFSYHSESHHDKFHRYGMFITLTKPLEKPRCDWKWNMQTGKHGWKIDWKPERLDIPGIIAAATAATAQREEQYKRAQAEIETKMRYVKVHLEPVSKEFVIGKPMLFSVKLINFGDADVSYELGDGAIVHHQNSNGDVILADNMRVRNPNGQLVPSETPPLREQIGLGPFEATLKPGATDILIDTIDLTQQRSIVIPGRYTVQFTGASLRFGTTLPPLKPTNVLTPFYNVRPQFVPARMTIPSNVLEIEVKPERVKK